MRELELTKKEFEELIDRLDIDLSNLRASIQAPLPTRKKQPSSWDTLSNKTEYVERHAFLMALYKKLKEAYTTNHPQQRGFKMSDAENLMWEYRSDDGVDLSKVPQF